jgi:hypothetical protein
MFRQLPQPVAPLPQLSERIPCPRAQLPRHRSGQRPRRTGRSAMPHPHCFPGPGPPTPVPQGSRNHCSPCPNPSGTGAAGGTAPGSLQRSQFAGARGAENAVWQHNRKGAFYPRPQFHQRQAGRARLRRRERG